MAKQYVNYVSPRGTAKWPKLDQPYSFNQSQNRSIADPDGQYEMALIMSPEDASLVKKLVEEAISQEGIKPTNLPYKKEIDKDTKKETGDIEVKFKAYGKKKDGSKNRIQFVDAKGNPLPASFRLTSGSVVKAAGYISVAKLGARLNLRKVQVLQYAKPQDDNPFEAEEGFEYDEDDFDNNEETNNGSTDEKTDTPDNTDF